MTLEQHETPTERPRRADATRNRERVLAAADELFRERGLEVGVGEIAELAGVGRGTLFRNFPTKQDLIAAIVVERMREGTAAARALLEAPGRDDAVFEFIGEIVGRQQVDRALFEAVADEFLANDEIAAAHAEVVEVIDGLLERGRRAGLVRPGIGAMDVILMTKGACMAASSLGELGLQVMERQLDMIRSAIAAPGYEVPVRGTAPTLEQVHAAHGLPPAAAGDTAA